MPPADGLGDSEELETGAVLATARLRPLGDPAAVGTRDPLSDLLTDAKLGCRFDHRLFPPLELSFSMVLLKHSPPTVAGAREGPTTVGIRRGSGGRHRTPWWP